MKNIYCISGLGADERIFQNFDIPEAKLIHIPWAEVNKKDDLLSYARKMSSKIEEDNPTILGLSFGGMLSVEIAKYRPVAKVFLISSAKTKNELIHGTGGLLSFLIRHDLIPAKFYTFPNALLFNRFGATTADEQQLLTAILNATDPHFVKWAMKALLLWENTTSLSSIIQIHGTADRIILPTHIKPDYWIKGGTHMMVYKRAKEISAIISSTL